MSTPLLNALEALATGDADGTLEVAKTTSKQLFPNAPADAIVDQALRLALLGSYMSAFMDGLQIALRDSLVAGRLVAEWQSTEGPIDDQQMAEADRVALEYALTTFRAACTEAPDVRPSPASNLWTPNEGKIS